VSSNKEGCNKKVVCRKMCGTHYQQWRRSTYQGELRSYIPIKGVVCKECGEPVQARLLCAKHYKADWRKTFPERAKEENRRNYLRELERRKEDEAKGIFGKRRAHHPKQEA